MAIIKSKDKLIVGKVYTDRWLTDGEGKRHDRMPFKVLRKSSREAWEAQAIAGGATPRGITRLTNFYEISID